MPTKNSYFYGLGRRKSATARVRVFNGKGHITVNGKPLSEYFADSKYLINKIEQPFVLLDLTEKFDVTAVVAGGGHDGQAEAIRLGISKALVELSEDYRSTLKRANLLTRDARERERKKFGLKGARKQRQFTKR